jgi:hypothetical protein
MVQAVQAFMSPPSHSSMSCSSSVAERRVLTGFADVPFGGGRFGLE